MTVDEGTIFRVEEKSQYSYGMPSGVSQKTFDELSIQNLNVNCLEQSKLESNWEQK